MTFVVAFFVALYSLGRHATGIEAWLGVGALVLTMAIFVNSEGGLAKADLGDFAFALVFAGAPWAAGLTFRLRRERETELNAENDRLRREQEERRPGRSPRSGPGSPASCTTWSPTPSR